MSSVRYGTRLGDLKNKQSTHTKTSNLFFVYLALSFSLARSLARSLSLSLSLSLARARALSASVFQSRISVRIRVCLSHCGALSFARRAINSSSCFGLGFSLDWITLSKAGEPVGSLLDAIAKPGANKKTLLDRSFHTFNNTDGTKMPWA